MATIHLRRSISRVIPHASRPRTLAPHTLAVLSLIGANVIWAGSASASKVVLANLPPLLMASCRIAIASFLLSLILRHRGLGIATGVAPAMLGLTGVTLFCACQNLGLLAADASTTALLGASTPILTVMLAVVLLRERFLAHRIAGLLISMLGVGMIMLMGSGQVSGATVIDALLPFASAASFALYNVLGRRSFPQGNALALVAGSTRYGLIFLLPATVAELVYSDIGPMSIRDGMLVLYLGAGCSAIAFILCGYGLTYIEAGQSGAYGNIKPLAGVALPVIVLDERLTLPQVGGGILILLGVTIAGRQWRPRHAQRRAELLIPGDPTLPADMAHPGNVRYTPMPEIAWSESDEGRP